MNSTELLTALNWRYATKSFDSSKKLDDSQINTLVESLRLSASSFGLQGRGFVVVENPALRQELLPHAYGQTQIVDSSHLIVLCRRTDVNELFVDKYIADIASTRNMTVESLQGMKDMLWGGVAARSDTDNAIWLSKQVYIALGTLLTSAAVLNIDAAPMEGFNPAKFDEILGLADHNLTSCVIAPVGFRSEKDPYATAPKVRFPLDQLIIRK